LNFLPSFIQYHCTKHFKQDSFHDISVSLFFPLVSPPSIYHLDGFSKSEKMSLLSKFAPPPENLRTKQMEIFLSATCSESSHIFTLCLYTSRPRDFLGANRYFQEWDRYRYRVRHLKINARGRYTTEPYYRREKSNERFCQPIYERSTRYRTFCWKTVSLDSADFRLYRTRKHCRTDDHRFHPSGSPVTLGNRYGRRTSCGVGHVEMR